MVVTTKQSKPERKILIDNNLIKQSHHIRYLGVLIDDILNWKQQIKEQCSKVARRSWAQLKHFVDEKTLRSVYHCLIYSHLPYCISSWGTALKSTLAPLFILRKRSITLLTGRVGIEDTRLEAKAKDTKKIRGQGQGQPFRGQTLSRPRTGMLEAKDQGHKRKCSPKKKRSSQKFFWRSPQKNVFQKIFQALHKILTIQKILLSSSRGQANFRGLEASRPSPRT